MGEIEAVDLDGGALRANATAMRARFLQAHGRYHKADSTLPLRLPTLDGIVMTNSLHFQTDQDVVVQQLRTYLRREGHLVIVEYNVEHGNSAVPYPRWEKLARDAGFQQTDLLARRPSRFLRETYSAVSR